MFIIDTNTAIQETFPSKILFVWHSIGLQKPSVVRRKLNVRMLNGLCQCVKKMDDIFVWVYESVSFCLKNQ